MQIHYLHFNLINEIKEKISLFLGFQGDYLELLLFSLKPYKTFSSLKLKLSEIVPNLVEKLEQELHSQNLEFDSLSSLYIHQTASRWNSNRLVVTFVKILGLLLPITIYTSVNENTSRNDFVEYLSSFKKTSWRELETLYNSCPITNT